MRRDDLLGAGIVVSSLIGVASAWAPWHSLALGAAEVRGIERFEGRVFVTALAFAVVLAGFSLVTRRPTPARQLVVLTTIAAAAALWYLVALARPASPVHEFVRDALGGTFRFGIAIASAAAASALILASVSLRRRPA